MEITIRDRITQYIIYAGYVSKAYYLELLKDTAFTITLNNL